MLPCKDCKYCQKLINSDKVRCTFNWDETGARYPEVIRNVNPMLYEFPNSYYPKWGINECIGFSKNTKS